MIIIRKVLICATMLLALSYTAFSQSVSNVKSLIENGMYLEAAKQLHPLADGGDAEAQYLAATLFFDGKGVNKSVRQATKYATLSAEQGYANAVKLLFDHITDSTKKYNLLSDYCERFPTIMQGELGMLLGSAYIYGRGVPKDLDKGYDIMEMNPILEQHIKDGDENWVEYQKYYEEKYEPNRFVSTLTGQEDDLEKIARMKKKLSFLDQSNKVWLFTVYLDNAKHGNVAAMTVVSDLCLTGWGTSVKTQVAKNWAQMSADKGSACGKLLLQTINTGSASISR